MSKSKTPPPEFLEFVRNLVVRPVSDGKDATTAREQMLAGEIATPPSPHKPLWDSTRVHPETNYALTRFIEGDEQTDEFRIATVDLMRVIERHPEDTGIIIAVIALVCEMEDLVDESNPQHN